MRSSFTFVLGILLATATAACDAKATPDECESACENVTKLYLGAVDKQAASDAVLTQMGATGAQMARDMATLQLEFLKKECSRECNAKATRKQTECLVTAKTPEDLNRCN